MRQRAGEQVKSGAIFGGYTTVAWSSDGLSKPDESAFLFSLTDGDRW